jgi:hypothetical protein
MLEVNIKRMKLVKTYGKVEERCLHQGTRLVCAKGMRWSAEMPVVTQVLTSLYTCVLVQLL